MTPTKIQLIGAVLAICITVAYGGVPKKIIKGSSALITELPHQVSLQTPSGFHFCGGTIIDAKHILTAAHCIVDGALKLRLKEIVVVTGTADRLNRTADNTFYVVKNHRRTDFNPADSFANDIAVLTLSRSIPFNEFQQSAKLPTAETPALTRVLSSGWGTTGYNEITRKYENYARFLQKLERIVVPEDKCQAVMPNSHITHGQICLWSQGGADSCTGDSGGPVTWNGYVIGITSWSEGCATNKPDIATRVSYYLPWIKNILAE